MEVAFKRYFEAASPVKQARRPHRAAACPDWANLPGDVLRTVVEAAAAADDDASPLKFAGVCKGWRWLLDDPHLRHALTFRCTATHRPRLLAALRSFALFVCSRAPATRELVVDVRLPAGHPLAPYVAAALAPALTHLAGELEGLALRHVTAAHALACSPFLDVCGRLQYLRCTVADDLDLSGVGSLRVADLTMDGPSARGLRLPDDLASLRVRVLGGADPAVLDALLAELRFMHQMTTFKLWTEHTCQVDVAALPATLTTLAIGGPVYLDLDIPELPAAAVMPALEVLSLTCCRLSAARLARFVRGCTRLRGLGLVDYLVDDLPGQVVDARHLPLRAVALVTSRASCLMEVLLPAAGLRALSAGHEDLYALRQPGVCDGLRVLKLPHAELMDLAALDALPLGTVGRVHVSSWNMSPVLAARLGQRCARAELVFEQRVAVDVEYDVAML